VLLKENTFERYEYPVVARRNQGFVEKIKKDIKKFGENTIIHRGRNLYFISSLGFG
jgi:hypothetical protein